MASRFTFVFATGQCVRAFHWTFMVDIYAEREKRKSFIFILKHISIAIVPMQHSWLHLCLPQFRFLVHFFLQRASSARVDSWAHLIIWSIFPHRHFTAVCLLHGGHGPIIYKKTIGKKNHRPNSKWENSLEQNESKPILWTLTIMAFTHTRVWIAGLTTC